MDPSREVVVTGMGVVCPIGIGQDDYWKSLQEGRSGVGPITLFDARYLPVRFGGEIDQFNPKLYVKPRKSIKVMCREIQTAFASAAMAVTDANLESTPVDPDRFGVLFGSEMLYGDVRDLEDVYRSSIVERRFVLDRFAERIASDLYPLWMLKNLPNMAACHIGIAYDARGPNNTIVQGDASSLLALAESVSVIQRGLTDVMIAGGTGSRLSLTAVMYRGDSNLSHCGDDPTKASRPFDRSRDGMVNGEGAAAFVLESRDHAEARGAEILCHVLGYGRAHQPQVNGPRRSGAAIRRTIDQAVAASQIEPDEIGHVNAHGVSTVEDDAVEATAIRDALGAVPVTAPKSYFGNLGAGSGAVEMVASVRGLLEREIPMTLNYSEPDPDCPVRIVCDQPQKSDKSAALLLSQSSTGQAVAVVVQRP